MKKSILVACGVVLGGLSAAAQQPQPITPPTQQTPPAPPSPTQPRPPDPDNPATQRPPTDTPPMQRPPNPDPPASGSPRPMADVSNTTTVTGCLQTWDSRALAPARGAGSGSGSAAAQVTDPSPTTSPNPAEFVLMKVEGSSRNGYLLRTTDAKVSFSAHLNHRVSVTGTVSDAARDSGRGTDRQADQPTGDKPSADRDASSSGRVSASDAKLPVLNVTAIKMISPTCGS
jgi:hypothetical protein